MFGWLIRRKAQAVDAKANGDPAVEAYPFLTASEVLAPYTSRLSKVWDRVRLSEDSRERLFDEPVLRFARYALNLPASRDHHDCHQGGLLAHTISTCELAVSKAEYKDHLPPPPPDDLLLRRYPDRYRAYLAFLGGLIHDLGKVLCLDVRTPAPGNRPALDPTWNPLEEDLEAFLKRTRAGSFTATFIKPQDGERHEALGALLFNRIITGQIISFISRPRALTLLSLLIRGQRLAPSAAAGDSAPIQPVRQTKDAALEAAVTAADRDATAQAISEQPKSNGSTASAKSEKSSAPQRRLAVLMKELREHFTRAKCPVNRDQGLLYCGGTYTAVVVPDAIEEPAKLANAVLQRLNLATLTDGRDHKNFYQLLGLTKPCFILGKTKVTAKLQAGGTLDMPVIIAFRNDLLWQQENEPAQFPGVFLGHVSVYTNAKRGSPKPVTIPGFFTHENHPAALQVPLVQLLKTLSSDAVNRPDSDIFFFDKVLIARASAISTSQLPAGIASRLTISIPETDPFDLQGFVLKREPLWPLSKTPSCKGSFRFQPCQQH